MRVVCSYCRKHLGNQPGEGAGVSHGMCGECDRYFERIWGGVSLGEYLEELPQPVILMDADGRVAAANHAMESTLGRSTRELRGLLGGEAMACSHSRLPEGCGRSVHCRACAIRRAVTEAAHTGRALHGVPAYLDRAEGRMPLTVDVEPQHGLFVVTVHPARAAP